MMQWSCPHCKTQLTTAVDHLGSGWSFSRCAHCNGYSLIRKTEINVIRVDKAPPGERIIPSQSYNSKEIRAEPQTDSPRPLSLALRSSPLPQPPVATPLITPDPSPHPSELAKRLNEKAQNQPSPPPFIPPTSVSQLSHPHTEHPIPQATPTLKDHTHSSQHSMRADRTMRSLESLPTLEPQKNNPTTTPHDPGAELHSSTPLPPQDLSLKTPSREETQTLSQITLSISGTQFPDREPRSQLQQAHSLFSHSPRSPSHSHPQTLVAILGILAGGFIVMNQRSMIFNHNSLEEVITDEVKQTALAPVASTEQHKKWVETQKELINAHDGPGSHFPVITQLAPYTLYEILDIQNSWIKVGLDHLPPELHTKAAWVPAQQVHFKNE